MEEMGPIEVWNGFYLSPDLTRYAARQGRKWEIGSIAFVWFPGHDDFINRGGLEHYGFRVGESWNENARGDNGTFSYQRQDPIHDVSRKDAMAWVDQNHGIPEKLQPTMKAVRWLAGEYASHVAAQSAIKAMAKDTGLTVPQCRLLVEAQEGGATGFVRRENGLWGHNGNGEYTSPTRKTLELIAEHGFLAFDGEKYNITSQLENFS